ncbi:hypothetical protein BDV59DRAFT_181919, partial [Aspergillus ambiguus]|uniref:uncharacterized protein n=1 Tax=Aspergillus ambiguus TaxID=176160 RepID=UPI003CCCEA03
MQPHFFDTPYTPLGYKYSTRSFRYLISCYINLHMYSGFPLGVLRHNALPLSMPLYSTGHYRRFGQFYLQHRQSTSLTEDPL